MIYLTQNIRHLRKEKKLTQDQLAGLLEVKRSLVGSYEEGRAVPKLAVIKRLADVFEVSIDQILTHDFRDGLPATPHTFKVLTTVVDVDNKERILVVPNKASAGYLNGFADPEYVETLPHFSMPLHEMSPEKTYRVFQIKGDSMLPVQPGSYVFCDYVESLDDINDGKTYVVISKDEGIVYKRVFEENGRLLLKSDNPEYQPYNIEGENVLELWRAIGFLSFDLPEPNTIQVGHLTALVKGLQEEVQGLKK